MRILIFLCILFPSIVFAESEITFIAPDVLYIEVQKGINCQKQFTLQTEKLRVMEDLVLTLEKENAISTEQIGVLDKKVNLLSELKTKNESSIVDLTNLIQVQKEGYEELLKKCKPSFWQKVKNNMLWIGVGFISGTVTAIIASN